MDVVLSKTLQALSDPTRRQILGMLRKGELNAGEIGAAFQISAPSISHHLNVLKNAELVQAQRKGQTIIYSLNESVVQELLKELFDLFNIGEENREE
ncbi:MAG TPA: autorepressor SdpR family transcription factor [Phototrophicaceae bacterium]|nr:autorepressor SdpR family transcription factor [Phototrophicaceae bacterium]